MNIQIRQVGKTMSTPASFIEMTVNANGSSITSDITNLKGFVDIDLINTLRQIADELEEQNNLLTELQ